MNIAKLKEQLETLGVPRMLYSLKGARDERLCIEMRDGVWYVFFVERGQEHVLNTFSEESEACMFMLEELRQEI